MIKTQEHTSISIHRKTRSGQIISPETLIIRSNISSPRVLDMLCCISRITISFLLLVHFFMVENLLNQPKILNWNGCLQLSYHAHESMIFTTRFLL